MSYPEIVFVAAEIMRILLINESIWITISQDKLNTQEKEVLWFVFQEVYFVAEQEEDSHGRLGTGR